MKKKLKQVLGTLCIWILTRVDKPRLKRIDINFGEIKVSAHKYIADDGKWHSFGFTTTFYAKAKKNKKPEQFDDVYIYADGKLRAHYKLEGI